LPDGLLMPGLTRSHAMFASDQEIAMLRDAAGVRMKQDRLIAAPPRARVPRRREVVRPSGARVH